VLPQADCHRVRRQVGVGVVVRDLEPRDDDEVVERQRPRGLGLDRRKVVAEVPLVDAGLREMPRVVAAQDVIGDAEQVDASP
jgi:hypothetical protein